MAAKKKTASRKAPSLEWCKGTKVVDAEGAPLVLYHGGALVDALEPSEWGAFGAGIYMTPSRALAESYVTTNAGIPVGVTEAYACIKQPLLVFAGSGIEQGLVTALAPFFPLASLRERLKRNSMLRGKGTVYGGIVPLLATSAGFDGVFVTGHSPGIFPPKRYFERVSNFIGEVIVFEDAQLLRAK